MAERRRDDREQDGGAAPAPTDPMRAGMQMWETGYRALLDSWRQTQEFWNNAARSWSEATSAWLGQTAQAGSAVSDEGTQVTRELQEASFAVAQAWLRLPLALMTGAPPTELQEAITRLTAAQGRAYQLWTESLGRMTAAVGNATATATRAAGQAAEQATERRR